MSKYIIELNDKCARGIVVFGKKDEEVISTTQYVENLEVLNSDYINEHFGSLQDDAYKRGLEDGKAVNDKGCEGCKFANVAGTHEPCVRCSNSYPNHWTAKDDKIVVGDEVKPFYTDITGVVTLIDGDTIYVLWRDGSSTSTLKLKEVTKTGRHFDIASILEEMRHD